MSNLNYDLLRYNALDCACTMEIDNTIMPDIDKLGFRWAYDFTMSLYEPIMFMQTRGIKVSMDAMSTTKVDILRKINETEIELNKVAGRELNANSPKDCAQYFYIERGIPAYYNKDGGVTTDDKALQRIARGTSRFRGLREAHLVQEIRGLRKLYGTYLDIDFDADDRIRCAYNPRGTKFGRISSSETVFGTGTNLQNLPQEFKKFLVSDEGYFLWECDKRQAEWVVVAYLSGDANMINVVESGEDPHTHTAHLMFKLPKDVIREEAKLIGLLNDAEEIVERREAAGMMQGNMPRTMSCRQMGKKSNHGLNYDEGPNTFALTNEIPIIESKRIISLYHSIYPGIRQWHEYVKRMLAKDRSLTNCFGRRIHFLDSWGDDLWKSAYSSVPQSSVADCTHIGIVKTYSDDYVCGTSGHNIDILTTTHDSVLFQVPISVLDETGANSFTHVISEVYSNLESEMEYNGRRFKIATDSKFGLNWSGYHADANPLGMMELNVTNSDIITKIKAHCVRAPS